jgi:hypothetical protein
MLHDLKSLNTDLVFARCVIDKQSRQIKDAREPSDYADDVKGFKPKVHGLPPLWELIKRREYNF